jgi:hypothetical protein
MRGEDKGSGMYLSRVNCELPMCLLLSSRAVQQGQSGTPVTVASYTYASIAAGGDTIYLMASSSVYPSGSAVTTGYAYTPFTGTTQIQYKVTTPPVVGTGQNGSGATYTITEEYDTYGNLIQSTDERGIVNDYTFDVVLARVCAFDQPHLHARILSCHHAIHLEVSHGYISKDYRTRDMA